MKIQLKQGDITKEVVDVIVNAANGGLLGGGGVDGAIHLAAGPSLLNECKKIRETKGRCATGSAVMTGAGNLKAKYVIHAVGPEWEGGGKREPQLLASAYRKSLELAEKAGMNSIAFPAISAGAYKYPAKDAAMIAMNTCEEAADELRSIKEIRFILFTEELLKIFQTALARIRGE